MPQWIVYTALAVVLALLVWHSWRKGPRSEDRGE